MPPTASNLLLRGSGVLCSLHRQLLGQFAVAQNLQAVLSLADETSVDERLRIDHSAVLKHIEVLDVDSRVVRTEDIGEALLRDATIQGHLAALEAGALAAAAAGLGTLVTLTGGLAQTGAHAAAKTLGSSGGTLGGMQLVQFHGLPSFTR